MGAYSRPSPKECRAQRSSSQRRSTGNISGSSRLVHLKGAGVGAPDAERSQAGVCRPVLLHSAGKDDYCGTARQCRLETWLALQRFKHTGQIRNLGVSNFGPRQIREVMALSGAPVAVNQIEFHPWVEPINKETVEFCHQHGIAVTAYGSMGSAGGASQILAQLGDLGTMHGRTAGQVLLRWAVQKNITVIPGTGNPAH